MMNVVCVVGSLNIDLSYAVSALPVPGETTLATDRAKAFGGKGGNQAVAIAVLGGEATFVGAVGTDEAGQDYRRHLRELGVGVDGIAAIPEVDTGSAIVVVDEQGENLIIVDPGANAALEAQWVMERVSISAPTMVLAQLEVPIAVLEAMATALPENATLVLNPAPMTPDPRALAGLLDRVDVLVPNRKELGQLVGQAEPVTIDDVKNCLTALSFSGTVVVTLGKDGVVVLEPDGTMVHHAALTVDPVDTTGAGDAFCGALVTWLCRGESLHRAVEHAVDVAGRSTLTRGAQLSRKALENAWA